MHSTKNDTIIFVWSLIPDRRHQKLCSTQPRRGSASNHHPEKRFIEERNREKGDTDPMNGSTETSLRHDLLYLRCILTHATERHRAQTPEDRLTKATLQDYLTWLTVDALKDVSHARSIAPTLARLQEELHAQARHNQTRNRDSTSQAYHEGYLHALEQILSFTHGEDLLLGEEISRHAFLESWDKTRERLGL